jgi:hypothetical protein
MRTHIVWRMRGLAFVVLVGCAGSRVGYLQPPLGTDQRVGFGGLLDLKYTREQPKPPVSLVPTDGSELGLVKLVGEVSIEGPIAHTKLHFTFVNAENRTREGRFSMTLPASAAVTQFAMKVHEEWREGTIVARQTGREVYERFLHRRTDPALLEQDLGNTFSARVFPIFGGEHKEIIVAYDHAVSDRYELALRGLPRVRELQISVDNNGERRTTAEHEALPQDVHVELVQGAVAAASGEAFVARVDAKGLTRTDAPMDRVLYLVDTSASRDEVMMKQVRVLHELVKQQAPQSAVVVAVFDQSVVEIDRGEAEDVKDRLGRILEHGALGASNLGRALDYARVAGMPRVVIIGDGVVTAGEHDGAKLAALVSGVERVDVVQVGQSLDRATMQQLVRAGRAPGAIIDGSDPDRAFRQLRSSVAEPVAIRVDGATAVWPTNTRHVAPGEPVFVYGLRSGAEAAPLVIHVGERTVTVTPRKGRALRRTVASRELADLVEQRARANGDAATKLDEQIEKLALAHSLISPRTSSIVLETDQDEQRFLAVDPPGASADATPKPMLIIPSSSPSAASLDPVRVQCIPPLLWFPELVISDPGDKVKGDTMSPLGLELTAEAIQHDAFAFQEHPFVESSSDWGWGSSAEPSSEPPGPVYEHPYTGTFERVMTAIAKHDHDALAIAAEWHAKSPGDVTAIVALGEALEARGFPQLAMRAYGSIADLFPNRAELLRAAGERLDRIPGATDLAIDFYRRALRERPDQVTSYRLLAYALFHANRLDEAFDVLREGSRATLGSTAGHMLHIDASIIGASIVARQPARRSEIRARIPGGIMEARGLWFVVSWETDATNIDLIVRGDASSFQKIDDGYGPEVFNAEDLRGSFELAAHYKNKAQAGVALGTLQIIRHDGAGHVSVENRPFAIQMENGRVELGYARW